MVEDTEVNEDQVHLKKTPNLTMIRRKGSVTRSGDCLLPVNTLLKAGELSLLASTGAIKPLIIPLPHALHITTGSEVVPPSATPALGQIRDTNSALIRALLEDAVVQSLTHIHVDESVAMLVEKIQKHPFDLLIISGGSSVGEYDRTHEALIQGGFHIHCHKVAVKPGKPLIFAQRDNQYALGFPGNPVSHFVTFHLFAMRILARLTGRHPQRFLNSILGKGANMKSDQRETFWPARMDHTALVRTVVPMPWLDSGDLTSLRNIDALIRIPSNHPALKEGDSVQIIVL
jgi:molybdopterin molybdotransferase